MERELEKFGLSSKETKIYLELLREKSCTASKLAKLTKLNRTTAYLQLENLIRLGLVSYVIKDSKKYFQAAQPERLISILNEKKEQIENILPDLKSLYSVQQLINIEVFEGKEGIKTFYQDILNSTKEFHVIGATGKAIEIMEFSYPHFIKKFIKSGIKEKALANYNSKDLMEKAHPKKFLDIKYLPKECLSHVTTVIYDGKVGIQSLQKDSIYVVVIKDKLLAETYRNYFDTMWQIAKR